MLKTVITTCRILGAVVVEVVEVVEVEAVGTATEGEWLVILRAMERVHRAVAVVVVVVLVVVVMRLGTIKAKKGRVKGRGLHQWSERK